jgi:hypothetical protein
MCSLWNLGPVRAHCCLQFPLYSCCSASSPTPAHPSNQRSAHNSLRLLRKISMLYTRPNFWKKPVSIVQRRVEARDLLLGLSTSLRCVRSTDILALRLINTRRMFLGIEHTSDATWCRVFSYKSHILTVSTSLMDINRCFIVKREVFSVER